MSGALAGITVLDFGTLLPGPLATLILADAGAEVVKVERPGGGDILRGYEPRFGPSSANFAIVNRGKQSFVADLKSEEGRAEVLGRVERCDVLLEQFRPGVMDRLGLGYEQLSAIHPGLVYCSITGFGQEGPRAGDAAHDLNYLADSGMLDLVGDPDPVLPHALIADVGGGAYPAAINILLALQQRQRSGRGCHLDIAMADNVYPFFYWAWAAAHGAGEWPRRGGELLTGGSPRYQLYRTADDRHLAVAALEEQFWQALCDRLGLADRLRDDRRDPAATQRELARIIASRTAAEWEEALRGADVCTTVVRSFEEAMTAARERADGLLELPVEPPGGGRAIPSLPTPVCEPVRAGGVRASYPALPDPAA